MDNSHHDALWRDFPKTLPEFEKRFPDEDTARAYFALLRWNGQPCCARCESTRVREIKSRARYDCADCGHQTSLTSGTVLEGTRKPIRLWLRAAFEMSVRRTESRPRTSSASWASAPTRQPGPGCTRSAMASHARNAQPSMANCRSTNASSAEKARKRRWFSSAPKWVVVFAWHMRRARTRKP